MKQRENSAAALLLVGSIALGLVCGMFCRRKIESVLDQIPDLFEGNKFRRGDG